MLFKKIITALIRKIIEPAWRNIMYDYDKEQGKFLKELSKKQSEQIINKTYHL